MSQFKSVAGSHNKFQAEFSPSAYLANKGLVIFFYRNFPVDWVAINNFVSVSIRKASSRQQRNEQTKTRPVSDCNAVKNSPENERQKAEAMKLADSSRHRHRNSHTQKTSEIEKSNEIFKNQLHRQEHDTLKQYVNKTHHNGVHQKSEPKPTFTPMPKFNPEFLRTYRTTIKNCESDSTSESEDEVDSMYDNEKSFHDDQSVAESLTACEDVDHSMEKMKKGLTKITSDYITRVKSHVDLAVASLKHQEKEKQKQHQKKKAFEDGDGDKRTLVTCDLYKKMEMTKNDCYRKIEANLMTLRNIDNITTEIYYNYKTADHWVSCAKDC